MSLDPDLKAAIAVTRFGLGARPGELGAARADAAAYLKAQITPTGAEQPPGSFASSATRITDLRVFQQDRRQARQQQAAADGAAPADMDPVKMAQKMLRDDAAGEFIARAALGATTDASFRERWALFWFNHFTVGQKNLETALLAGPFEREAIRPHVFGRFEDMLVASSTHPGMLLYLDQAQSIGPNSQLAAMAKTGFVPGLKNLGGLNENLAREIMELHTLGVGSGYTQADVTEFARAITGWSIVGLNERRFGAGAGGGAPGEFTFRALAHEPGSRTILGKTYPAGGIEQGRAVLHDLAASRATAHHIAVKLARHFVADDPPPTLVAKLEQSYSASGGRLDQVARTLVDAPEAWAPDQRKFKTPYEFLISSYRSIGLAPGLEITPVLNELGQRPFSAPSPKGWSEDASDWASADGVVKRLSWAEAFSARNAPPSEPPLQLAENTLGARLNANTQTAINRAESRSEAFSILLMSPEFQRR
ncbi:MAG TPA: DUF1800 domain-containing protein [Caulobacteraceae bacterium]|nr:DUF1800 domain-containing protein [Caulobacteraceae bacterium]